MAGLTTIVVSSNKSVDCHWSADKETFYVSYSLARALEFSEPHYARLVQVHGADSDLLVFADFVVESHVNGEFEQYLGCTSSFVSCSNWVPVRSNQIASVGYLHTRGGHWPISELGTDLALTFVIEIVPHSWFHGGTASAGRC